MVLLELFATKRINRKRLCRFPLEVVIIGLLSKAEWVLLLLVIKLVVSIRTVSVAFP